MKTIVTFLLILTLTVPVFAQTSAGDKPPEKEKWSVVKFEASVEDINKDTREITLKGPQGDLVTLTATETIERFDEIGIGDTVEAEYRTFMRAEFRDPTAEEKMTPFVVVKGVDRASKERDPAGVVGAVVRAVVEVISIDKKGRLVVIQGPRGNVTILPVEDDAVLNNLKVGEVVIMTYAEALALSLKKVREKK
jgi:hypothetical protein